MRRILHLTGAMNRAGAETLIMNLYRNLDKQKFQFDFVYFTNAACDYDAEIKKLGGNIYRIPNTKKNRFLNILCRYYGFFKLLKKLPNHNIIHSHINLNGTFFLVIAYLLNRKIRIAHSHSSNRPNSLPKKINRYITTFLIKHFANMYLTCGDKAADYLFPKIDKMRIIKFPNCIELQKFDKEKFNKNFLREKLFLDPQDLLILQVGSLTPVKNHNFSLTLIKYLKQRNRNVHLILAGNGGLRKQLEAKVKDLDIADNVSFLGTCENISEIMYSSDLLIMPSIVEGFPMVLIEAQACGLHSYISDTISKEVDLGLDLVSFISLNEELKIWEENIFSVNNRIKPDSSEIMKVLKLNNFDALNSVENLQRLYSHSDENIISN